jgi:hypothetical protein
LRTKYPPATILIAFQPARLTDTESRRVLLRLFTFRPDRAGDSADELLRRSILPALLQMPGLVYVYAARASATEGDTRVVATVWGGDASAASQGLDRPFDFESSDHVLDVDVESHNLDLELAFEGAGIPQILRIFRGRTVPGELDNYVGHARRGTMADALADHGPEALFLARIPPDGFVTASTGGNLRQPIGTRYSELLAGGTAAFFEIVPNTPSGHVDAVTSPDGSAAPAGSPDQSDPPPSLVALAELPGALGNG